MCNEFHARNLMVQIPTKMRDGVRIWSSSWEVRSSLWPYFWVLAGPSPSFHPPVCLPYSYLV